MTFTEDFAGTFSDEENNNGWEEAGGGDWRNFEIRFGKFRGHNLSQMLEKSRTRAYLRYILGWQDIRPNTAENIRKALAHYENIKAARAALMKDDLPPMQPPLLRRESSRAV